MSKRPVFFERTSKYVELKPGSKLLLNLRLTKDATTEEILNVELLSFETVSNISLAVKIGEYVLKMTLEDIERFNEIITPKHT